jgi:hypothetical protein
MSLPVSVKPGPDGKLQVVWSPAAIRKAREVAGYILTSLPVSVKPGPDGKLQVVWSPAAIRKAREVAGYILTSAVALGPKGPLSGAMSIGAELNDYLDTLEAQDKPAAQGEGKED